MAAIIRRKNVKKGFTFTLMLVGGSGLGKTTFINTLADSKLREELPTENPDSILTEKTLEITSSVFEMDEDGVKLTLTVVDTPGFGDELNNNESYKTVLSYIENQYNEVLQEETRIKRNPKFQDNRIHALLYFLPPTGHALKEMDIDFIRTVGHRVNVIPVIAKADSLTTTEMKEYKDRVMKDIDFHKLPIFAFPYDPEEDTAETINENRELFNMLPFTIIGSENTYNVNGRQVRGRKYPWGISEVDNSKHCDFSRLRYVLLSSHLEDLKDFTHDHLYEQYRTQMLSEEDARLKAGGAVKSSGSSAVDLMNQ